MQLHAKIEKNSTRAMKTADNDKAKHILNTRVKCKINKNRLERDGKQQSIDYCRYCKRTYSS
tara:strand:- start:304 stop:489 length:186 start_codon:yes stop_codon:yes gene_type:complete